MSPVRLIRKSSWVSDLIPSDSRRGIDLEISIARAHDITAVLDGREVPVFIEAGGQQAAITIPGAGSFKLQVRRTGSRGRRQTGGVA